MLRWNHRNKPPFVNSNFIHYYVFPPKTHMLMSALRLYRLFQEWFSWLYRQSSPQQRASNSQGTRVTLNCPPSFSSSLCSSHPVEGASRRFRLSLMRWQLVWTSQLTRWSRRPEGPPRTWQEPRASLDRTSATLWRLGLTWLEHPRSVW